MYKLISTYILLIFSISIYAQTDSLQQSGFLVKPYLQYSTKTSMVVLWETKSLCNATVEYGEAKLDQDQADLSQKVSLEGQRLMHEVLLQDLKPETNYFWRAISETANGERWISETYSFKTTVKDSSAMLFALVGDSQWNKDTPWAWAKIAEGVWKERPNFIVHAGDLVDWGPKKTDWTKHFFPGGQKLMARIPMYTVLGNHEGDADLYYQYMANPQPEYRYTFKYGNVQFFMLDSNRDLSEGSEQYNWLDQALSKSQATWKIVIHHHPPYSSESDDHGDTFKEASTMGTKSRNLVPLYDKYNVDFCLFGHTHVYERTWPLKNNRINQKEGTIYINSGGAGGFLETFAPTRNWFTLEIQEAHHFCTFAIYDKTMVFKAIDHEGRVFDSFQMEKSMDRNINSVLIEPPAPIIESERFVFENVTQANLNAGLENLDLYYTLDGSNPNRQSLKFTQPFTIKSSTVLKTRAYTKDGKASRIAERSFTKMEPLIASATGDTEPGWTYNYYEGDWRNNKSNFFIDANKKKTGILKIAKLDGINGNDGSYWGVTIEGYLDVSNTDTYTFYALDSRGLEITIDGVELFNSADEQQLVNSIVLEKGQHKIAIKSYQRQWRKAFSFGFYDPVLGRIPFKPSQLSH